MANDRREKSIKLEPSAIADWFVAAIQSDGSVRDCLGQVINDLRVKHEFIEDLMESIGEKSRSSPDAVTEIGQQIRHLENTLRFRLTILSPERKGAWYRPASATTGPFKENLLSEPIFSTYDENHHHRVRTGLISCWEQRNLLNFPFRATDASLWKVILTLNFELEKMDLLQRSKLRISELPDHLPSHLDSRATRAFLINVRAEIVSHRHRLTTCFRTLLEACERFWRHHATDSSQREDRPFEFKRSPGAHAAGKAPTTPRPKYKSATDIEALRFMGFSDYPSNEDLKQRYHALALTMHPDKPTGNEQRFKMLTRSYKHLTKVMRP